MSYFVIHPDVHAVFAYTTDSQREQDRQPYVRAVREVRLNEGAFASVRWNDNRYPGRADHQRVRGHGVRDRRANGVPVHAGGGGAGLW